MADTRYSAWDGSQDPFGSRLDMDEVSDRIADDVLDGWSVTEALERLLREGMPGQFSGLDALRDRIREMRRRAQEKIGADSPLAEVRERLERIVDLERLELSADDSDDARFKEVSLDALPTSLAQQINELRRHDFASDVASEEFDSLLTDLRQDVIDRTFRQVSEAIRSPDPEDLAALKDMLADLNRMLDQRRAGVEPSDEEFESFMDQHGAFFPENPANLDELLDAMARRAAAFSQFMANLSPEQQAEMMELMDAVMDDVDLSFQMNQLGQSLRALAPELGWDRPAAGSAPEGADLASALNAIEDLSALDDLDTALGQRYPGASLADVDVEELARNLDADAARDLKRLKEIEKQLEQAGVISRTAGKVELTPRGVRKLGEKALSKVFERLVSAQPGSHDVPTAGGIGDPTGTSRPWQFGDPFRLDLQRTLHNAVVRGQTGPSVKLAPEDFEVAEHEYKTAVATVLLLDMSRSMPLRGHWLGAKRMALALHALISGSYPEDHFEIVAFSDYARVMSPTDLGQVDWEPVYGTNMEHAFNLAGRILARHRGATKQVLLVTDGEPTAHLEGDQVFFQWPPARETIERTYKEAMRLARSGITMNIFMLESEPGLVAFIDRLARIVNGRVFATNSDSLGDMIVSDYLKR